MLELKNLTFEVPLADGSKETKRIIDDLSLTIPDGRFTVITGPNGGGKSTLAKLIMGVERATSGQILLDGEDITDPVSYTHLDVYKRQRLHHARLGHAADELVGRP